MTEGLTAFSASSREAMERHADSLRQFETRQRQRLVAVPTSDDEVKLLLRQNGQPICLFGERALDRRERLKRVIAEKEVDFEASGGVSSAASASAASSAASSSRDKQQQQQKRGFFTPASNELMALRQRLANESWKRSKARLHHEREQAELGAATAAASLSSSWSQVATLNEPRPVSSCAFSPAEGGSMLVTASFDHQVRIYDSSSTSTGGFPLVHTLMGHTNRVCHAIFAGADNNQAVVCSGSAEGQVRVWSLPSSSSSSSPTSPTSVQLTGHVGRVGRLAAVGSEWLVSTSFDRTFRLWDLAQEKSILLQDGHARELYACAVHPDQSLLCTTDMGGAVRVWDLRCAATTHVFSGHTLGVLACDFAKNGWLLATGSLDNTARVWDLRKTASLSVLPCHLQGVTACKFVGGGSDALLTASHDRSVAVWDFESGKRLMHMPKLHEGPILGMDYHCTSSANSGVVCTVGHDRAVKFIEMTAAA